MGYGLAELGAQVNLLDQGGKYAECFTGKFRTCLGAEQSTWYAALYGMGLCQGRMCALTVADIIADTHGKSSQGIGSFCGRPPLIPVTLGELAESAD